MRLHALLTIITCLPFVCWAQQMPQYSLYNLNPHAYHPGYIGASQKIEAVAAFRQQWVGLRGSPHAQHLNFHLPLSYLSSGVGMNVENDMLGALRYTSVSLEYAYGKEFQRGWRLALGVSGGMAQSALDGGRLLAPDGEYGGASPNHNDGRLPVGNTSAISFTLGTGLYLKGEALDIGLSVRNLTESNVDFGFDNVTNIVLLRQYVVYLSYHIQVGRRFGLRPSLMAKTDFTQSQAEMSVLADYDGRFRFGLSYRGYDANTGDAVVLTGAVRIFPRYWLAYAYDITVSALSAVSQGSHEIMLKYELDKRIGKGKLPKIIHNPRLL